MIILLLILIACILLFGRKTTKSIIGAILTWIAIMAIAANLLM